MHSQQNIKINSLVVLRIHTQTTVNTTSNKKFYNLMQLFLLK